MTSSCGANYRVWAVQSSLVIAWSIFYNKLTPLVRWLNIWFLWWHSESGIVELNVLLVWSPLAQSHGTIIVNYHSKEIIKTYISHDVKYALHWRLNANDDGLNRRRPDNLLNPLFRRRSEKTSKLRAREWPLWGESTSDRCFPSHKASEAKNVSIWWRHHVIITKSHSCHDIMLQYCTTQVSLHSWCPYIRRPAPTRFTISEGHIDCPFYTQYVALCKFCFLSN